MNINNWFHLNVSKLDVIEVYLSILFLTCLKILTKDLFELSGLDPAGPCFFKYITTTRDPKEYLDMSDATLVQTIHTNGEDLGFVSTRTLSHYEFYPNGGRRQPGISTKLYL